MNTQLNFKSQANRPILSGSEKNIRVSEQKIRNSTISGKEPPKLYPEVIISNEDAEDQQTTGNKIDKTLYLNIRHSNWSNLNHPIISNSRTPPDLKQSKICDKDVIMRKIPKLAKSKKFLFLYNPA
jgi:hypothetical protein